MADHVLNPLIKDTLLEGYIELQSFNEDIKANTPIYYIKDMNKRTEEIFDVDKANYLNKPIEALFVEYSELWEELKNQLDNSDITKELEYCCSDTKRYFLIKAVRFSDDKLILFIQEITLQKQGEDALIIHKILLDNTQDIIIYFNESGQVVNVNTKACEQYGYTREQLLEMKIGDLNKDSNLECFPQEIENDGVKDVVFESIHSRFDGSRFPVEVNARRIKTQTGQFTIHIIRDLTKRKEQEAKIAWLARYDALTGALNRASFFEQFEIELERAKRGRRGVAVLLLDLDKFKLVNDNYGNEAGDFMLKHLATRLKSTLRLTDCVGRLGEDKFIILQTNVKVTGDLISLAERILNIFKTPIDYKGHSVHVTTSIGIALFPEHAKKASELLYLVEQAVEYKKSLGGNGYYLSS